MALDYSEFAQYRKNFSNLAVEFDKWLHAFLINEGLRFISEVKRRTPTDTGDLRNHWALDGITRDGDDIKCWFVNPMRYATFVEYGHAKPYKSGATEGSVDWTDGYFMMTVSLDKIEKNLPSRFDRSFNQFITSLGVK